MKINELAKLSGVNPETIRMYRNRNLLFPTRNPHNGYYDYSLEDFMNLLYLRKLRKSNVSLESISRLNNSSHLAEVIDNYNQELASIEASIRQLQHQKSLLELTLNHLENCREIDGVVQEIDSFDDKYDCYCLDDKTNPGVGIWLNHMEMFTPTLKLLRSDLEQEKVPLHIPVQVGIGTYRHVLDNTSFPIPPKIDILPKGRFLTLTVRLKQLNYLPGNQIKPLLDYVAKHHLQFEGDTTAFLIRVDSTGKDRTFIYRLRIKIKPQEP